MKAKAKAGTTSNIKPMAGGGAIATLTGGQYVFGDLSSQATDIINFDHYYMANDVKVLLHEPCKVSIGTNLILTNETEPTTPPDPDPDPEPQPEPAGFPESFTLTNSDPNHPDFGKSAEYQKV